MGRSAPLLSSSGEVVLAGVQSLLPRRARSCAAPTQTAPRHNAAQRGRRGGERNVSYVAEAFRELATLRAHREARCSGGRGRLCGSRRAGVARSSGGRPRAPQRGRNRATGEGSLSVDVALTL